MKEFKVKKGVSKEPFIWGMKLPFFIFFISVIAINALLLTTGISIKKFLIASITIVVSYIVLKLFSTMNIVKLMFSDKFPGTIKNDL